MNDNYSFWGEVDTQTQDSYIRKAKELIQSIENNVINGNWTTAINMVIEHPAVEIEMLLLDPDDQISLADYVIKALRS